MAKKSQSHANQYFIPMEVSEETIRDYGFSKDDVKWTLLGNKKCRVVLVPATKAQFDAFMQPLWAEQKRESRERRCVVSGKEGKLIRCPDSRFCVQCPHYQHIDMEDNKPSSVEMLVEKSAEPAASNVFEDDVVNLMLLDVLIERATELNPEYSEILRLMLDELPQAEIAKRLHINPRTLNDKIQRIRELARIIFNEQ